MWIGYLTSYYVFSLALKNVTPNYNFADIFVSFFTGINLYSINNEFFLLWSGYLILPLLITFLCSILVKERQDDIENYKKSQDWPIKEAVSYLVSRKELCYIDIASNKEEKTDNIWTKRDRFILQCKIDRYYHYIELNGGNNQMDVKTVSAYAEVKIEDNDTAESLHDKLSAISVPLLMKTLPSIINGTNKREKKHIVHSKFE